MYDGCLLDAHGGFCWCISSDKRHQCVCVKGGKTCCLWQVLLKTSPTLHALASPSCVKKVVTNKWGKTETKRKEQRLLRGRQKARAPGRRTIDKPRSRSEGWGGGSTRQGLAWWEDLHKKYNDQYWEGQSGNHLWLAKQVQAREDKPAQQSFAELRGLLRFRASWRKFWCWQKGTGAMYQVGKGEKWTQCSDKLTVLLLWLLALPPVVVRW